MNDWNGQGEGHFKWREQQHAQVQKHEKLLFMCMLGNSLAAEGFKAVKGEGPTCFLEWMFWLQQGIRFSGRKVTSDLCRAMSVGCMERSQV